LDGLPLSLFSVATGEIFAFPLSRIRELLENFTLTTGFALAFLDYGKKKVFPFLYCLERWPSTSLAAPKIREPPFFLSPP